MKVTLDKGYRDHYTLSDLDRAKEIIKSLREDDTSTTEDYARSAATEALKGVPGIVNENGYTDDYVIEIIRAKARTAKNYRIWGGYSEDSQDMDVWVEGIAKTYRGYLEFGAYLTDIWSTGLEDYNQHMYIRYYKGI